MRLIDGDKLFEFLSDQPVKEVGAFSKGVNKGLNIARSAIRNVDVVKPIDPETLPIVRELKEKLERVTAERDEVRRDCAVAERNHSECLAQLAKARAQLKFAVADMEALMWHSGDGCNICRHCVEVHREPYVRLDCGLGSGCECKPEWRGVAP